MQKENYNNLVNKYNFNKSYKVKKDLIIIIIKIIIKEIIKILILIVQEMEIKIIIFIISVKIIQDG